MSQPFAPASRRTLLIRAAALTGLPLLAAAGSAQAAGTLPQATAKYQDKPGANGQTCEACAYFVPNAAHPKSAGQCKLVAGSIAPAGWCQLFAPKR
jgi:High potential iron-sulfur protein